MKKVCVYKITSPSGRIYVGSTIDFNRRMSYYKKLHCKRQPKIHASLNKHGFDRHSVEILEVTTTDFLLKREHYWGMVYDVLAKGNLNSALPKGDEKYPVVSEEVRLKIGRASKNRIVSEETRMKLSKASKGRKPSEEAIRRSIEARKGRKFSESHKRKLSEAKIGKACICRRKIIFCFNSGVYYEGLKEASKATIFNSKYLSMMLTGSKKNKTSLGYV